MKPASGRSRVLDPLERFSEIVFGLVMVLSFTCALGVADSSREDVRAMLVGALGCNLAWGLIDAVFYLIGRLCEHGRNRSVLLSARRAGSPEHARRVIADALPAVVAEALGPADLDRVRARLDTLPEPSARPRLAAEDWRGAAGVFLLVFLSTLPVIVPFILMRDAWLALRVSNVVAIAMLFGAGFMLAGHAGLRRVRTGLAMVVVGALLVGIAIALGG